MRAEKGSIPVCSARPNRSHLSCWSMAHMSLTLAAQKWQCFKWLTFHCLSKWGLYVRKYSCMTALCEMVSILHAIMAIFLTYLETAMSCSWKSSLIISRTPASGYIIHMSPITSWMVSGVCAVTHQTGLVQWTWKITSISNDPDAKDEHDGASS